MPELGEVEIVRRNLLQWWQGRAAAEVRLFDERLLKNAAFDEFERALGGRLDRPARRGKHLLCHFEGGKTVIFHFRMTGKIIRCDEPDPEYARLSWFVDGVGWLVFKDQRCLGEARVFDQDELACYAPIAKLGPEPQDVTVEHLREVCSDRRMLKTALLDQSVVAGVGNIAVSELLWRLELAPDVRCGALSGDDWRRLVEEMPRYFEEVVEASMADEVHYLEEAGAANPFRVYGCDGEPCPRCGAELEKTRVGGRSSYYCPDCQGR